MWSQKLKKIFVSFILIAFTAFPTQISLAAGITQPTGPQTATGITDTVGPSQPSGPTQETGVTQPTGPQTATGPTTETGPLPETVSGDTGDTVSGQAVENSNIPDENTQAAPEISTSGVQDNTGGTASNLISVDNEAEINNNATLGLNTGGNNVANNTVIGNITTGNIDATVNILNLGNTVLAQGSTFTCQSLQGGSGDILLSPGASAQQIDISGTNNTTGPDSINVNLLDLDNSLEIVYQNDAVANNDIEISADTGNNTIANNTVAGNLTTGDINLGVNLFNLLNLALPQLMLSLNVWNILGDLSGDLKVIASNLQTGSGSENTNNISANNSAEISSQQTAEINNNSEMSANTGNNTVSSNTVAGNIRTGNSSLLNNTTNIANITSPEYYILNIFGYWDGDYHGLNPDLVYINLVNEETGSNSQNGNSLESDNSLEADLINNAEVNNNLKISANTGNNSVSNNSKIGNITTGSINVKQNITNILNCFDKNISKLALNIINIFGNWHKKPKPPVTPVDNNPDGDRGGGNETPADQTARDSSNNPATVAASSGTGSSSRKATLVSSNSTSTPILSNSIEAGANLDQQSNTLPASQEEAPRHSWLLYYLLLAAIVAASGFAYAGYYIKRSR